MRIIITVVLLSFLAASCNGAKSDDTKSLSEWLEELSVENIIDCNNNSVLSVDNCVSESFEVYQPFIASYHTPSLLAATYIYYVYDGYKVIFLSGFYVPDEHFDPSVKECVNPVYNNESSGKRFLCDELI